jgi:hypothetical protein
MSPPYCKANLTSTKGDMLDRTDEGLRGRSLISLCGSKHLVHGVCWGDAQHLQLYRWIGTRARGLSMALHRHEKRHREHDGSENNGRARPIRPLGLAMKVQLTEHYVL